MTSPALGPLRLPQPFELPVVLHVHFVNSGDSAVSAIHLLPDASVISG